MKLANITKYKSSLLGIVLIITSIYLMTQGITTDATLNGGLLACGILLLFTGDRFIQKLERLVFGKILFEKREGQE
jgi:uncharacterized membrane protein YkgB